MMPKLETTVQMVAREMGMPEEELRAVCPREIAILEPNGP